MIFLYYLLIVSLIAVFIIIIANSFDTLQKFKSYEVPASIFWQLIMLKIPHIINEISSLIGFISTVFFLNHILNTNELLIVLTNKISMLQIIIITVVIVILWNILLLLLDPIAVTSIAKYDSIASVIIKNKNNNFIISKSKIYFLETINGIKRFIQANSINQNQNKIYGATILEFDHQNSLKQRLDADVLEISGSILKIFNTTISINNINGAEMLKHEILYVPTSLSIDNMVSQIIKPERLTLWNLKSQINRLIKLGIPETNYKICYYKKLFRPILAASMVLIAFCYTKVSRTKTKKNYVMVIKLISGVMIYFMSEIIIKILVYSGLHPIFSIGLLIISIIGISNFIILHSNET
ncbi:YjgP/YjgQ family permease [Rickettsia endosymbiont of Cardiosporidium cionae]|nr:YjgP/YjgQ family permease [Rickettsia endosymbiont of Cardiosporidium cionae]